VDHFFGTPVSDPYRWLEDPEDAEVKAWVERQNLCTDKYFQSGNIQQNMEKFKNRLTALFDYDKYGCPWQYGGWIFFMKKEGLQNQYVLYKQRGPDGTPEVLLDTNKLREDGTAALRTYAFTTDGNKMAYGISYSGSDWYTVKVRDVATGKDYQEEINWCKFGGVAWEKHGRGFFYVKYPAPSSSGKEDGAGTELDASLGQKICYHKLNTLESEDQLVYETPDTPKWLFGLEVTDDGAFLLLTVHEGCDPENRLFVYDLAHFDGSNIQSMGEIVKFIDHFDHKYSYITNEGRTFWFVTNMNAPKSKVMKVELPDGDLSLLSPEALQSVDIVDIVPEEEGVLEGVYIAGGNRLVLLYLRDVKHEIEITVLSGGPRTKVDLPGPGSIQGIGANKFQDHFFFQFISFEDPGTNFVAKFNEEGTVTTTTFQKVIVEGLDASEFLTRQVFYQTKDKTKIPMFIISSKNAPEGPAPCLLYGYGGFNISMTPGYSVSRLIFVKHFGGVMAIANIRGGGEYGDDWHKAGTLHNKQNVFDDFIAAAEYLQNTQITSSSKLAIMGGSNGGLLVGACINQRPELFAAAISQVGVMDMLRFHKFTIGHAWCSDFGNPEADEGQFKTLLAYSPVHNVGNADRYPATLLTTGDHDDRVVPLHSYKYIAAVQEKIGTKPTQEMPLLIRIDTKSGHGAGKPTSKIIEEISENYTFIAENTSAVWSN